MKKVYYDLHIHTGLSPCAENEMSPCNIVNMAVLKGLDVIAITDHNAAGNVSVVMEVAKKQNLLVIPGIEVETIEGCHILCYFKTLTELRAFEQHIYANLPNIINKVELFGEQIFYDCDDHQKGLELRLLLNACQLTLANVIRDVYQRNGAVCLAHIDRRKNGIISVLGFIPKDLKYDCIELTNADPLYREKHQLTHVTILKNSDAHRLSDINERSEFVTLKERSVESFIDHLRGDNVAGYIDACT